VGRRSQLEQLSDVQSKAEAFLERTNNSQEIGNDGKIRTNGTRELAYLYAGQLRQKLFALLQSLNVQQKSEVQWDKIGHLLTNLKNTSTNLAIRFLLNGNRKQLEAVIGNLLANEILEEEEEVANFRKRMKL